VESTRVGYKQNGKTASLVQERGDRENLELPLSEKKKKKASPPRKRNRGGAKKQKKDGYLQRGRRNKKEKGSVQF